MILTDCIIAIFAYSRVLRAILKLFLREVTPCAAVLSAVN